tara:strand:- start:508 stop:702 length:195 start_codon:yes stop_codon:yes gene_type:complete
MNSEDIISIVEDALAQEGLTGAEIQVDPEADGHWLTIGDETVHIDPATSERELADYAVWMAESA